MPVDRQAAYFVGAGAAPGNIGTQMGVMHCIPGRQSAGPWQGQEHFPAGTLHFPVPHTESFVQGGPCGFGFIPAVPAAGGAAGAGAGAPGAGAIVGAG
jgi:hypothetical protein